MTNAASDAIPPRKEGKLEPMARWANLHRPENNPKAGVVEAGMIGKSSL